MNWKTSLLIFLSIVTFYCCSKTSIHTGGVSNTSFSIDSISLKGDSIQPDLSYTTSYSFDSIQIFQVMPYYNSELVKSLFKVSDTILGLFKVNDSYQLKHCFITQVDEMINECTGDTMIAPVLNIKDSCLFLFKGISNFIPTPHIYALKQNTVWTTTQLNFNFLDLSYTFSAIGNVVNNYMTTDGYYEEVTDYKLYLSSGDKKQCLLYMDKFYDTKPLIRWAGDIDGDRKPDFIIESPRWYEDYRILLYLSSYAEEGDLVKLVSIMYESFDC